MGSARMRPVATLCPMASRNVNPAPSMAFLPAALPRERSEGLSRIRGPSLLVTRVSLGSTGTAPLLEADASVKGGAGPIASAATPPDVVGRAPNAPRVVPGVGDPTGVRQRHRF